MWDYNSFLDVPLVFLAIGALLLLLPGVGGRGTRVDLKRTSVTSCDGNSKTQVSVCYEPASLYFPRTF